MDKKLLELLEFERNITGTPVNRLINQAVHHYIDYLDTQREIKSIGGPTAYEVREHALTRWGLLIYGKV